MLPIPGHAPSTGPGAGTREGTSLGCTGDTAGTWGSTREGQVDPPLGHIPSLGTPAMWLYQTSQPSTCWGTPGCPEPLATALFVFTPTMFQKSQFWDCFTLAQPEGEEEQTPLGLERAQTPFGGCCIIPKLLLQLPLARQPVLAPAHVLVGDMSLSQIPVVCPHQHSQRCEMETPGEGRDGC